ncbi:hypothetical protein PLICRDRAFT_53438 [Plicaturopsis crispa FD-325 SS-3]|nr:hypothetical protein PLICRDRAFT_53438 [Plicaturopsis crispa FD-325 SS-3]
MRCLDCDGPTAWDDEVGSAICTSCGTLVDATQSILESHLEVADTSGREYHNPWLSGATTLKSVVRGRTNWDLAGQGKEVRDKKNMNAMVQFIRSLATTLHAPGLAPRACTLFSQAMSRGKYRWGRKAKRVAGASLGIAFREAHRPDSLRDISFLLSDTPTALSRTFSQVVRVLGLQVASADPAQHFPVIQSHLNLMTTSETPFTLPQPLINLLTSVDMISVMRTAEDIIPLLARHPHLPLTTRQTPPTACALVILSLEAATRTPLQHINPLSKALGGRFSVSGQLVMQRYKELQDFIEECTREVPWLQSYSRGNGRAKISKRGIVARALKDVVAFQNEIWHKRLENAGCPLIQLETEDDDKDDDDKDDEKKDDYPSLQEAFNPVSACKPVPDAAGSQSRKRRRIRPIEDASRFLLNPISGPVPSCIANTPPSSPSRGAAVHPMTSYLLTASPGTMTLHPPTRLQLLTAARGGEDAVNDEELFMEGELEEFIRAEGERTALQDLWAADENEEANEGPRPKKRIKTVSSSVKSKDSENGKENRGSKRIDMDALNRFLADPDSDEEAVEAWRPLSPGGFGDDIGRYDEEW